MLEFAPEQRTAVEFAARVCQIVNEASLALMISVGHRTKLFDVMATRPSWAASELADAARLSERYVREWLGAMVTGGIVTFDVRAGRYALPAAHAACLTRAAGPNNIAVTTQWIPILAAAEDEVVEAFVHGKGVPYSRYPRFHEVMAEEGQHTVGWGLGAMWGREQTLEMLEAAGVRDVRVEPLPHDPINNYYLAAKAR